MFRYRKEKNDPAKERGLTIIEAAKGLGIGVSTLYKRIAFKPELYTPNKGALRGSIYPRYHYDLLLDVENGEITMDEAIKHLTERKRNRNLERNENTLKR